MTAEVETEPLVSTAKRLISEHWQATEYMLTEECQRAALTPDEMAGYGDAAALYQHTFEIALRDGRKLFAGAKLLTALIKEQKPFSFARKCLVAFDALSVEDDLPALRVLHDPSIARPKHGNIMWNRRIEPLQAALPGVSSRTIERTVARLQLAGLVEDCDITQAPQSGGPYEIDNVAKYEIVSSGITTDAGALIVSAFDAGSPKS